MYNNHLLIHVVLYQKMLSLIWLNLPISVTLFFHEDFNIKDFEKYKISQRLIPLLMGYITSLLLL